MDILADGGSFVPKSPSLAEIATKAASIVALDPTNFKLIPVSEIKKHPDTGTKPGLDLDFKSIIADDSLLSLPAPIFDPKKLQMFENKSFSMVFEAPLNQTLVEMLYGETEEQRLNREMSRLAWDLPGAKNLVKCPGCLAAVSEHQSWMISHDYLIRTIAHLNDHHEWDRNKIADWLDELADAGLINIDF